MPGPRTDRSRVARPDALRRGLLRLLADLRRDVVTTLEHPAAPPKVLHDLHREIRRLAGGLELWSELLRARERERIVPTIERMRRLARGVGRVRDHDVSVELLEPMARARSRVPEREVIRALLQRLREDGAIGRELLRATLTTEIRRGLLDEVRAALELPPRASAVREFDRVVREEWQVHRRKTVKAHRKARRRPDGQRLHRLRIRLRRWRHLAALADVAGVPAPGALAPGLAGLQARLGHVHDLEVALASVPERLGRAPTVRRLSQELEDERRGIRAALEQGSSLGRPRPAGRTRRRG